MAGIGTYYDFNCGNKSNPGVGCNAYGKPLCRTCTFNKTHTKSHSICPNIPCLNKTKTVEHVFLGAVVPHTWDQCGGSPPYAEDCYSTPPPPPGTNACHVCLICLVCRHISSTNMFLQHFELTSTTAHCPVHMPKHLKRGGWPI